MNYQQYEQEKQKLMHTCKSFEEYEEEIKKLVKRLEKERKNEAIKQRMGKLKSYLKVRKNKTLILR